MSDQLVGVVVGALIGFAGTALITLFQWWIEREKRREQRLWQYRQEHVQRLRPAWERLLGFLYESMTFSGDVIKTFESHARLQETESPEKLKELLKEAEEVAGAGRHIIAQASEVLAETLSLESIPDPKLRESIDKGASKVLGATKDILNAVDSGIYADCSPDEIAKVAKRLSEHRQALIEGMREAETSIERYLTDL